MSRVSTDLLSLMQPQQRKLPQIIYMHYNNTTNLITSFRMPSVELRKLIVATDKVAANMNVQVD